MMVKTAFRYIIYRLFAPHRKGFGVHSPFVFHLVTKVLNSKDSPKLKEIEDWRKRLRNDPSILLTSDAGAGSKTHAEKKRTVSGIARKSSIHHKYGRMMFKLVQDVKPACIIELGSGIGISTVYLAMAAPDATVVSIEADTSKINFAAGQIELLRLKNVSLLNGFFRDLLPETLQTATHPLFVFVDGDHSYNGTLEYFNSIRKFAGTDTVIVFDDIRWSAGMEKVWDTIKACPDVVLTIDLFFMGIVFFREGMTKQDFVVNV